MSSLTAMLATTALATISAEALQRGGRGGMPPARVRTSLLEIGTISDEREFVGTVAAPRLSIVAGEGEGRLVELAVEEGDRVEAGQTLARLRTETLEIERAAAEAVLALRESELKELENGARPEELRQAEAGLARATAEHEYRKWIHERERKLVEDGASSREALEDATRQLERAAQDLNEAGATLDLVRAGPRAERIEQARAQAEAQREQVRRIDDAIGRQTVAAPFAGYVTAKLTEVGQWIGRGDAVVELAALDWVDVVAFVTEENVGGLKIGSTAGVVLAAIGGERIDGRVAAIVPKADAGSRTFPVKIRLPNRETNGSPAIKAGMFARVSLPVGGRREALLAPKDALVLGGPTPAVYVVVPSPQDPEQSIVRLTPVQVGAASGNSIEVRGELSAGDRVVIEGNERLQPGQPVVSIDGGGGARLKRERQP